MNLKKLAGITGIALAVCGCGSSETEAKSSAKPLVPASAQIAGGMNLPGKGALKNLAAQVEAEAIKASEKSNGMLSADDVKEGMKEVYECLDKTGLGETDLEWVVFAAGVANGPVSGSLAIGGENDLAALMTKLAAFAEEKQIPFPVVKSELNGRTVWKIEGENRKDAPILTSVNGKVTVVALGEQSLNEMIELYTTGKGAHPAFGKDFLAADQLINISVPDIQSICAEAGVDLTKEVGMMGPGAREIAHAKAMDLVLTKKGKLTFSITFASETDAKTVTDILNGGLAMAKSQWRQMLSMAVKGADDEEIVAIIDPIVQSITLTQTGVKGTLSVDFGEDFIAKAKTIGELVLKQMPGACGSCEIEDSEEVEMEIGDPEMRALEAELEGKLESEL